MSQAGRTQSVLQALPVHNFLSSWSADSIISKLEHGPFSGVSKGLHLLKWRVVTAPKASGGFGLKNLDLFRTSLLHPDLIKQFEELKQSSFAF